MISVTWTNQHLAPDWFLLVSSPKRIIGLRTKFRLPEEAWIPQEDCLEFSRMSRIDGFPDGFNLSTVNGMFSSSQATCTGHFTSSQKEIVQE